MSALFKVGEMVIGQNFVDYPEYNGEELQIVGMLAFRYGTDAITGAHVKGFCYQVLDSQGVIFQCGAFNLRRRKPPASTTGEQRIIAMLRDAKTTVRDEAPA